MLNAKTKRTPLAICAAIGAAAVIGAVAAPAASASTIPPGHIQICAQGDYHSSIQILPQPIPGVLATTGGLDMVPVAPGEPCFMTNFDTHGATVEVRIWGFRPDGTAIPMYSQFYNSAEGLGIGTQGTSSAPYYWLW
ncbi:hypothetical protein Kisp01_71700 [Kineosporia sp. NBRC 101677]|uniref:hypothetical protein n=1 Tax=Kineosporia sp. NBRC 101677 TaxID=3032197 RepID=UPI0024A50E70|nr:hypothetical protein [Kineosporia sp. NBRC 101677]GLY20156.1 hypothetical protein Kisp01_71700 [Kineosporia sp. NBRC 101677]